MPADTFSWRPRTFRSHPTADLSSAPARRRQEGHSTVHRARTAARPLSRLAVARRGHSPRRERSVDHQRHERPRRPAAQRPSERQPWSTDSARRLGAHRAAAPGGEPVAATSSTARTPTTPGPRADGAQGRSGGAHPDRSVEPDARQHNRGGERTGRDQTAGRDGGRGQDARAHLVGGAGRLHRRTHAVHAIRPAAIVPSTMNRSATTIACAPPRSETASIGRVERPCPGRAWD